jgi:hypothetical protein
VSKKSLVSDFNNTGLNHIYNTYKQKGAITIDSDGNKIKNDIPNYKKNNFKEKNIEVGDYSVVINVTDASNFVTSYTKQFSIT